MLVLSFVARLLRLAKPPHDLLDVECMDIESSPLEVVLSAVGGRMESAGVESSCGRAGSERLGESILSWCLEERADVDAEG